MKVLLIADIGKTDYGFYHVGDEAMFYETCRWYQRELPHTILGALSRSISHANLHIQEHIHLDYPIESKVARHYFFGLMGRTLLLRVLHIDKLSDEERRFLTEILQYSVFHFTGGGNIYSICVSWLYYVYYLFFVAFIYGKCSILTSQTIGPLYGIDHFFAAIFLNLPKLIAIREPYQQQGLARYHVLRPHVVSMLDVAYTLPIDTNYRLLPTKSIRIGLSLHALRGYEVNILSVTAAAINSLAQDRQVEIVIIPHILVHKTVNEWDSWYMQGLKELLNKHSKIKVVELSYEEIMRGNSEPAIVIKYLTSQMDVLITTRYHGVIFALSENIPVLALSAGEYYDRKNTYALQFLYGNNYEKYLINLDQSSLEKKFRSRLKWLVDNRTREKDQLIKANKKLQTDKQLFILEQLPAWFE